MRRMDCQSPFLDLSSHLCSITVQCMYGNVHTLMHTYGHLSLNFLTVTAKANFQQLYTSSSCCTEPLVGCFRCFEIFLLSWSMAGLEAFPSPGETNPWLLLPRRYLCKFPQEERRPWAWGIPTELWVGFMSPSDHLLKMTFTHYQFLGDLFFSFRGPMVRR